MTNNPNQYHMFDTQTGLYFDNQGRYYFPGHSEPMTNEQFINVKFNIDNRMFDENTGLFYDNQGYYYYPDSNNALTLEQVSNIQYNNANRSYDESRGLFYDEYGNYYYPESNTPIQNENNSANNNFNKTTQNINETPPIFNKSTTNINRNKYQETRTEVVQNNEPKKKSNNILLPFLAFLLFITLTAGGYFAWSYYKNSNSTVDLSKYEVNFVAYGTDGQGKPEVDIKTIPTVNNESTEIKDFLAKPDVSFDVKNNLKNGDKVEVTLSLNENTAKKLKLKTTGSFKKSFTVNGLSSKEKEKETIIVKENNSTSNNTSSSASSQKYNERTMYVIPNDGVNLRNEPNTSSRVLKTAKVGSSVRQHHTTTTSNGETWSYVTFEGTDGWIRSDLLK